MGNQIERFIIEKLFYDDANGDERKVSIRTSPCTNIQMNFTVELSFNEIKKSN